MLGVTLCHTHAKILDIINRSQIAFFLKKYDFYVTNK